jgi:hypothetical protein
MVLGLEDLPGFEFLYEVVGKVKVDGLILGE